MPMWPTNGGRRPPSIQRKAERLGPFPVRNRISTDFRKERTRLEEISQEDAGAGIPIVAGVADVRECARNPLRGQLIAQPEVKIVVSAGARHRRVAALYARAIL